MTKMVSVALAQVGRRSDEGGSNVCDQNVHYSTHYLHYDALPVKEEDSHIAGIGELTPGWPLHLLVCSQAMLWNSSITE